MKVVATYMVTHNGVLKALYETVIGWYISLDTTCELFEIPADAAESLIKERREFIKANKAV